MDTHIDGGFLLKNVRQAVTLQVLITQAIFAKRRRIPMIIFKNVNKFYNKDFHAVENMNLHINEGELLR